jgi:hypothetical protein
MISYCWADTTFVLDRLCMALAPLVEDMWLDRLGGDEGLAQGMTDWARASMDRGVAGADAIIAVVSPKYTQSKNCGFEMELCHKHKKEVIPIVLGLPFGDWCALKKIGETELTTQFHDAATGDGKLFVDFSKPELFETKLHQELLPRMVNMQQQTQQQPQQQPHMQMRAAVQRQPPLTPPPHPSARGAVRRSASAGHRGSPAIPDADLAHIFVNNMAFNSSINTGGGGIGGGGGGGMYEDSTALLPKGN